MVKKILFVCKYNRFRSKFAEAYFNSVNKNESIVAGSAGIIRSGRDGFCNLKRRWRYVFEKIGVRLKGRPRIVSVDMLKNFDKVIIVANDVPKEIFNYPKWRDKVVVWDVPDEWNEDKGKINKILKTIMRKVDLLVRELNESG